jgi:hypothetical protein
MADEGGGLTRRLEGAKKARKRWNSKIARKDAKVKKILKAKC